MITMRSGFSGALRHLVAAALGEVAPTVLGDHPSDVDTVFFKLRCIRDDVLDNQISSHDQPPAVALRGDDQSQQKWNQ
jgi:hypothetical protein